MHRQRQRIISLASLTGLLIIPSFLITVWATPGERVKSPVACTSQSFSVRTISVPVPPGYAVAIADFNGDGALDIYAPNTGGTTVSVLLNTCSSSSGNKIADFDGDGKTDLSIYRAPGDWYIRLSTTNTLYGRPGFGDPGDQIRPGDFDGDRKSDIAIFRPTNGYWYMISSADNSYKVMGWGSNGDIPMLGDFDGDGKTDISVFRDGFWYIRQSSNGGFRAEHWGQAGDAPVTSAYLP